MAIYQFAIANGWDVPLVNLTNVENLPQQGIYKFPPPSVVPGVDDGTEKFAGDGSLYLEGYPMVPWYMGQFRFALWHYLYATQASGLRKSKQTIYTLTYPGGSYARYNTWMFLPKPQRSATDFNVLSNYSVLMTRLVAL